METGGEDGGHFNVNIHIYIIVIKYLVHNLLGIVTKFFVKFIKAPALLKICFKNFFLFASKIRNRLILPQTIT